MAFEPNVQEDCERYDNILEAFGGEENGEARESVAAKEHFSSDQSFKVICDVPCKGDKGAKDDKNSSSLFDLHDFEELETNNSHNSKESESDKRKGDTDANMFQDKTKRSFVTIDVRLVVVLYIIMELELTVISRMYTKLHGLNTLITFDPCKEESSRKNCRKSMFILVKFVMHL